MDFFQKYKKILLILGFLFITIILGYIIYSVFFKPAISQPEPGTSISTTTTDGLPIAGEGSGQIIEPGGESSLPIEEQENIEQQASTIARGGLTKTSSLNQDSALNPTMGKNGSDLQYYNKIDGKFYKIDKNGETELLSNKVFHNVEKITWSPQKNKAILEYPDGANIVYDFDSQNQITLPQHWQDFNFSPDGNKIVLESIGTDPDNRWLAISNEDGSNVRAIEAIGENAASVYPSWSPNNQSIAMYTEGIDFNRQEVYFVGLNNENFKSTVIEGRGFQPKWSPAGDQLVYSVYSSDNDLKPSLWTVNAQGDNIGSGRNRINLETWAEKCSFGSDSSLYCAVPENLEEGAGLFPELAENTKDNLYKIDIKTGLKKLIAVPDGTYNMSNLNISEDNRYLYFTDNKNQQLYKIQLK